MAQGLLGGVLPAIYSGADQLKRGVYGLLTNPVEQAQRAGQSLLQSHNERQALMKQAFADPTNPTKVTNPQALNTLTEQVMAGELGFAPAGITAWHGSPHTFNKFDISKIGTGEGAQAYGYGGYFAEAPAVAGQYAKELGQKIDVNGKPLMEKGKIVGSTGNAELDDFLVANLGDIKATRKDLLQSIKEVRPTNPEGAKDYQRLLADLRKSNIATENTGNLYKVDIPDEYIPKMLDWDKPLKDQPKAVQDALAKYDPDSFSSKGMDYDPNERGQWIYMRLAGDTTQKNASNKLNELGIKGIRYLDEGSRAKGGTSNFVVFDPETVKILERNNQGLLD